jgi:hypothetical protein
MQAPTILIAISSILIFEGSRRVLATGRSAFGWAAIAFGLFCLIAIAYIEVSNHSVHKSLAATFEPQPFDSKPPWSSPREALPNLPLAEQAEKTRIIAASRYTSTGEFLEHLSPQGEVVRYAPTQSEATQREEWLSLRVASQTNLAHTNDKPTYLLLVVLVSALAAWAFSARRRSGAA